MKKISSGKIILFLVGLAIIFLAVRSIIIEKKGVTTTATITNVDVKELREDNGGYRYEITQHFKYTVDGKEYFGSDKTVLRDSNWKKNDGMYFYKNVNDKKNQTSLKIKYLPSNPSMSNVVTSSGSNAVWQVVLAILGVVLIVVAFISKPAQKAVTTGPSNTYIPPQQTIQNTGYPQQQQPVQNSYTTSQQQTAPKFCPKCGTPTTGGQFCENCGNKLV